MTITRLTRGLGAATVAALVISGASLALATPAFAAGTLVTNADVAPDASAYKGWHIQKGSVVVGVDGARLGADSYLLNGFVGAGQPGLPATGTDLGALITAATVTVQSGAISFEVPFSVGTATPPASGNWGTLYSVDGASTQTLSSAWISSKSITNPADASQVLVPADTQLALGDILAALDIAGDLKYSGFGVFASAPAVVSAIAFGADSYTFGRLVSVTPASATVTVAASSIRPNESTYAGWHEGYVNATPAFAVDKNGLSLGHGGHSQVINGLSTPIANADLASLLASAGLTGVSGEVSFQVPLFFGTGDNFATIRPALAATTDVAGFSLESQWASSRPIGTIPRDTPVRLANLIAALEAEGPVRVLAFGVHGAQDSAAVVGGIVWNGTTYSFVPPTTSGVGGAKELTATGADSALLVGLSGVLLLLGFAAVAVRRRSTRASNA